MLTGETGILFIFPGQGSQYRGMGSDLYEEFDSARRVYQHASEVVGYDVAELSFKDPDGRLDQTRYTQPALLTHSIACLEVFNDLTEGAMKPLVTAGHSLGEYSALVASGALPFDSALRLVAVRGELMGRHGSGKMLALSMDRDTVTEFVHRFYCEIGGCNLPEQTVVGGRESDIAALAAYVKQNFGKQGVLLRTEGAFHTYLMMAAAEAFRGVLGEADLRPPTAAVISNHSGQYHDPDPDAIRASLFFQIFNPVKWIWGMNEVLRDASRTVVAILEFGGGAGAGEVPAQKRPNLEGITGKSLRALGHPAVYLPAISSATLKRAAAFFRSFRRLSPKPTDHPPRSPGSTVEGNAVDENWYHLFVPTSRGFPVAAAVQVMSDVDSLGLGKIVQVCGQTLEENRGDLASFFPEAPAAPEPFLEMVVGCETGALLHYRGDDLQEQLRLLAQRLHPGRRP